MKKIFFALVAALMLFAMSSCDDSRQASYTKYETDIFSIEYPKHWEIETGVYSVRPFSCASDHLIVAIGTRLVNSTPLDSFVEERIRSYEEQQWGFSLVSKEVNGDEARICYKNVSDEMVLGTTMRIIRHGDYFYGVDGTYETEAERDTIEHIVNSLTFK